MIEIIDHARCVGCDICVQICPTDVFDRAEEGPPIVARQEVCQTCFMCEAHCPADAMYVSPLRAPAPLGSPYRDALTLSDSGVMGSYRARLGWGRGRRLPHTIRELLKLADFGPRATPEAERDGRE